MKIQRQGDTLQISGVRELGTGNAHRFRDQVRTEMVDGLRHVEVDLSETSFIDSCGLGALIALHKTVSARNGKLRLLRPQPAVRQILDLTRMNLIFEITL